jgi:hypothetical protein
MPGTKREFLDLGIDSLVNEFTILFANDWFDPGRWKRMIKRQAP